MPVHIRPEGVVIHKKKPHHHFVFYSCLAVALIGVVSGWSLTVGQSLLKSMAGIRGEWQGARGAVSELGDKAGEAAQNPISDVTSAIRRAVQGREAIQAVTEIMKEQLNASQK